MLLLDFVYHIAHVPYYLKLDRVVVLKVVIAALKGELVEILTLHNRSSQLVYGCSWKAGLQKACKVMVDLARKVEHIQ